MGLGAQIEAWRLRLSLGAQIEAWRLRSSLGAQIEAWRLIGRNIRYHRVGVPIFLKVIRHKGSSSASDMPRGGYSSFVPPRVAPTTGEQCAADAACLCPLWFFCFFVHVFWKLVSAY